MHHLLVHFLSFLILLSFVDSIPGIEFGDNKAKKYFTEANGLAEITFKENMSKNYKHTYIYIFNVRRFKILINIKLFIVNCFSMSN